MNRNRVCCQSCRVRTSGHIFSKIGLSLALKEHGIHTPDSLVARDEEELNTSAHALGYPILVKLDSSAGGLGVFECLDGADVEALGKTLTRYPVLVQRKIAGTRGSPGGFLPRGGIGAFCLFCSGKIEI